MRQKDILARVLGIESLASEWLCAGRFGIRSYRSDSLHETRRVLQESFFKSDQLQVPENRQQFCRTQEKIRIGWFPHGFIAMGKSFINEYAARRQTLDDGRKQRSPQIIGDDDGPELLWPVVLARQQWL